MKKRLVTQAVFSLVIGVLFGVLSLTSNDGFAASSIPALFLGAALSMRGISILRSAGILVLMVMVGAILSIINTSLFTVVLMLATLITFATIRPKDTKVSRWLYFVHNVFWATAIGLAVYLGVTFWGIVALIAAVALPLLLWYHEAFDMDPYV